MRIVIAEDSAVVRAGLAEILADSGHQVLAALPAERGGRPVDTVWLRAELGLESMKPGGPA